MISCQESVRLWNKLLKTELVVTIEELRNHAYSPEEEGGAVNIRLRSASAYFSAVVILIGLVGEE